MCVFWNGQGKRKVEEPSDFHGLGSDQTVIYRCTSPLVPPTQGPLGPVLDTGQGLVDGTQVR